MTDYSRFLHPSGDISNSGVVLAQGDAAADTLTAILNREAGAPAWSATSLLNLETWTPDGWTNSRSIMTTDATPTATCRFHLGGVGALPPTQTITAMMVLFRVYGVADYFSSGICVITVPGITDPLISVQYGGSNYQNDIRTTGNVWSEAWDRSALNAPWTVTITPHMLYGVGPPMYLLGVAVKLVSPDPFPTRRRVMVC